MKILRLNPIYYIIFSILCLAIVFFFDQALGVGLIFITFLSAVTLLCINRSKKHAKALRILFLIVFLIHIITVLFIYYVQFQPFGGGGGDFNFYHQQAQEVAESIRQGNLSLQGVSTIHFYPVIVGYLYAFTVPNMLIGQIFNAWLVAIAILFVYLIVCEIGGTKKEGFLMGLIAGVYPSLIFYGGLLLKDALIVLLCMAGLLLTLKIIKTFTWRAFSVFYILLIALTHFRFYISFALILTFIICWLVFSNFQIKKRIICGLIMIFLFGFLPQIYSGYGYFGEKVLKQYLNIQTISYYRDAGYNPTNQPTQVQPQSTAPQSIVPQPTVPQSTSSQPISPSISVNVSVLVKTGLESPFTFVKNASLSFVSVLLGPFPWQMKKIVHLFILPEVIAWYFLFFFAVKGIVNAIKKQQKEIWPLVIFSIGVFIILAIFISNFGIVTRIRIPALLALLCLFPFGFKGLENIKIPLLSKIFDSSHGEQKRSCLNFSIAKRELNWQPEYDLKRGLSITAEWFKKRINIWT